MRTTLTIDDDVLAAARTIAEQHHRSLGEVVCALARQSLGKPRVTLDVVNALRDEAP